MFSLFNVGCFYITVLQHGVVLSQWTIVLYKQNVMGFEELAWFAFLQLVNLQLNINKAVVCWKLDSTCFSAFVIYS